MKKENTNNAKTAYNIFFKRLFDFVFSFVFIICFFPLLVVAVFLNCFFTKFHPLFFQTRCGKNGKDFLIIKLRTLKLDAPNYEEKCKADYYTKIGFFLRRTHLDELPQLFNIFIGQMSFIGPRPIILTLDEQINRRIEDGTIQLRPGLSGLAQINERDRELSQMEKCAFDKEYLCNLSFKLDFCVFFKSIAVVFVNLFRKRLK